MNNFRTFWNGLMIVSICATAVLLLGFGWAVKDMLLPDLNQMDHTEKAEEAIKPAVGTLEKASEIQIVALGDSLTKGTGDATGEGYVKRVVKGLHTELNKPVRVLNNLAINGMQADELADRLHNDNGFKYAIQQANLILLTIGGNDLFQSARAKNAGKKLTASTISSITNELPEALDHFKQVITELNIINKNAQIVYIGLYNPFYDIEVLRNGSLDVQQWNKEAYAILHTYPNMMMIPTFDLFEGKITDYLSPDHFHPNQQGYERIAARIVESLN